uniref:RING-type domain-containing protein n=1 Tax=Pelodiscus sinensis TaxID=13735 RepID=K7FP14_PELSI
MATATPVREIQEEAKCPICLECLDPVTLHCGYNFHRCCIMQHCGTWAELGSDLLYYPSCRAQTQKGALRNNYPPANIVEKLKQVDLKPGNGNVRERHGKALVLFFEEDGEAMCVVCWRSPKHRSHWVLLLDEAAQTHRHIELKQSVSVLLAGQERRE